MEKINDIVGIIDDNQVIAIESDNESSQYFFGTKQEINKENKTLLERTILDKQIINDVLCLTI